MIRRFLEKILNWLKRRDNKKYAVDSSIYPKGHDKYIKTDRELLLEKEEENKYLRDELDSIENTYEEIEYYNPESRVYSKAYTQKPHIEPRKRSNSHNTKRTILEKTHYVYRDEDYYRDDSPSIIDDLIMTEVVDDVTRTDLGTDMLVADMVFGGDNIVSDIIRAEVMADVIENVVDDSWSGGYDSSYDNNSYDSGYDNSWDSNW